MTLNTVRWLTAHKNVLRSLLYTHICTETLQALQSLDSSRRTCLMEYSEDKHMADNCLAFQASRCHRNRWRTSRSEYLACCLCNPTSTSTSTHYYTTLHSRIQGHSHTMHTHTHTHTSVHSTRIKI